MIFDDIKFEVSDADIVSFDVFDTLITRLVLHPIDVFAVAGILAKQRLNIDFDFKTARIEAEKSLQNTSARKSYNLDDIYGVIAANHHLSDECRHMLTDIELEVEKKLLIPRKDVLDFYNSLLEEGKKIILVSDMYLSAWQIKELLCSCGYRSENADVFVSNEHNAIKEDGSLWDTVLTKYPSKKIVHIGDSYRSDYGSARKKGIVSFCLQSSLEKYQHTKMASTLSSYDDGSVGNSVLLGTFCNGILFNHAFSDEYDSNEVLGFFDGAIFSCFMRWLINTRDDSLLLFVTREGFIFQPMYLAYCKSAGIEPQKNCLFYTSRQAVSRASIRNRKDLEDLLSMKYTGSLIGFVTRKCGYPVNENDIEDFSISLPKDKSKVLKALVGILPELIEHSQQARKVYDRYIECCCEENSSDTLTIVDIGYLATTQFLLTKVTEKKVKGKYLITDIGVYPEIIGEVSSLGKTAEAVHPIHNNIQFFESSIQVPYGQLLAVDQNEKGGFEFSFNNAKQTAPIILNAQKECLRFAEKDAEWFGYLNKEFDYSLNLAEDIWMCLIYYNYLPAEYLNSFSFDDEFNGDEMLRYDPELHAFKTSTQTIPFAFSKNKHNAYRKQQVKNFVKKHTPSFLYSTLKKIWIKFVR